MERNKRGQLGNLNGIILTIVIVGILIGVSFLVLTSFKTSMSGDVTTVTAEVVTPTSTGTTLAYANSTTGVYCYNSGTIVTIVNRSGANIPIDASNYSFDGTTGIIRNITKIIPNTQWNITYTYKSGDVACDGVQKVLTTTHTIPEFLPIIVILLVVGILLAIVFSVMPKALSGGKETAYV